VQTIKAIARRRWPDDVSDPHYAWYPPLPAGPALQRAVAYALSRPGVFVNTTADGTLIRATLEAAVAWQRGELTVDDALLTADEAALGVSALFDGADLERI
jgi:hypothetical protein